MMLRYAALFALLLSALFAAALLQSKDPFDKSQVVVEIPRGLPVGVIQLMLEDKKVIKGGAPFAAMARVLNSEKKAQAGKYAFSPSDSLMVILLKLCRGEVLPAEQVKVVFPEGASIYKMGKILGEMRVGDPVRFQDLVNEGISAKLREKYWSLFKYISSESLEGYLYPDTYFFYREAEVEEIVDKMLKRFEEMVIPFWEKAAKDSTYSLHEILTLASIIEKEAKKPDERPIISSVFHNRLRAGMPLAADPTIKYALENPTKKVFLGQLAVNSPYNTYKRKGLPPGPICNPGIASIAAAVYPAKTKYFFFVARKDGSHIFSRSWTEHQSARSRNE